MGNNSSSPGAFCYSIVRVANEKTVRLDVGHALSFEGDTLRDGRLLLVNAARQILTCRVQ